MVISPLTLLRVGLIDLQSFLLPSEFDSTLQTVTWNIQGKSLENLQEVWPEVPLEPDLIFLQEVGGSYESSELPYHQLEFVAPGGFEYEAFVYHPPACFRKVAVLLRRDLVPNVAAFVPLTAGLLLRCRFQAACFLRAAFTFHTPRERTVKRFGRSPYKSCMIAWFEFVIRIMFCLELMRICNFACLVMVRPLCMSENLCSIVWSGIHRS